MSEKLAQPPVEHTPEATCYRLRLFVAGTEPNSVQARAVLTRLCETYLRDRYALEIVDVYENYQAAIEHQVVVVPTLIVESPAPVRTIVGSLSDKAKLLAALGLVEEGGRL